LYLLDWKPLVTSAIWGSDPGVLNMLHDTYDLHPVTLIKGVHGSGFLTPGGIRNFWYIRYNTQNSVKFCRIDLTEKFCVIPQNFAKLRAFLHTEFRIYFMVIPDSPLAAPGRFYTTKAFTAPGRDTTGALKCVLWEIYEILYMKLITIFLKILSIMQHRIFRSSAEF
jgi:hypothetical protein